MKHIKRKIDAYFFDIEDGEYVAISDQVTFYGGMAFMIVTACFIRICV